MVDSRGESGRRKRGRERERDGKEEEETRRTGEASSAPRPEDRSDVRQDPSRTETDRPYFPYRRRISGERENPIAGASSPTTGSVSSGMSELYARRPVYVHHLVSASADRSLDLSLFIKR